MDNQETNLQSTDPVKAVVGMVGEETTLPAVSEPPQGGEENVSAKETQADPSKEAVTVEELNALAGRQFSSKDEGLKWLKGLNTLVGDQAIAEQRRKATGYDSVASKYNTLLGAFAESNAMTIDEASRFVSENVGVAPQGTPQPTSESQALREVQDLKSQLEAKDFVVAHPEAKDALEAIRAVASQKGITLEQAYTESNLAKLLSPKIEGAVTTEPNKRIGVTSQEKAALEQDLAKGNATFEKKQAYVRMTGLAG